MIRQQSARRVRVPHRLRIHSDEVNALLSTYPLSLGGLPAGVQEVRDLRVAFESGRVIVTGLVDAWGRQMHLTVAGRVVPNGAGSIAFDAEEMHLGRLPLPEGFRALVSERVESEVQRRVKETGIFVEAIQIGNGVMILDGASGAR